MLKEPPKNSREKTKNLLLTLQDKICSGLENVDGKGKFTEESWLRDEGGGGRSSRGRRRLPGTGFCRGSPLWRSSHRGLP